MKTKYEETIGFIKTAFTITKGLFEETEPHTFRMFTLLQIDSQKIRSYK
jgi:hypothetical protein